MFVYLRESDGTIFLLHYCQCAKTALNVAVYAKISSQEAMKFDRVKFSMGKVSGEVQRKLP